MVPLSSRGFLVRALATGQIKEEEFIQQIHKCKPLASFLWETDQAEFNAFNQRYFQNEEEDKLQGFSEKETKRYMALLFLATAEEKTKSPI